MPSIVHYAEIFSLNLLVEFLVVLAILGWARPWLVFKVELLLNACTHPIIWFGLLKLPGSYMQNLVVAEVIVTSVEVGMGVWLLRSFYSKRRAGIAILAANLVTFALTFVVNG